MESFFLAETIKYLYLIFDEKNFLHSNGEYATEHRTSLGRLKIFIFFHFTKIFILIGSCFLDTGYVYNTEAHPIDIGALDCCTSSSFFNEKSSKKIEENLLVTKKKNFLV
jgi:mannosidase alpha-like ER degradation enhancer 2